MKTVLSEDEKDFMKVKFNLKAEEMEWLSCPKNLLQNGRTLRGDFGVCWDLPRVVGNLTAARKGQKNRRPMNRQQE